MVPRSCLPVAQAAMRLAVEGLAQEPVVEVQGKLATYAGQACPVPVLLLVLLLQAPLAEVLD